MIANDRSGVENESDLPVLLPVRSAQATDDLESVSREVEDTKKT